jgi:hypothetical protein
VSSASNDDRLPLPRTPPNDVTPAKAGAQFDVEAGWCVSGARRCSRTACGDRAADFFDDSRDSAGGRGTVLA